MKARQLKLECKNCDHEFDASYYAGSPGTYWEPPDDPELDIPEECPHCHKPLDYETYLAVADGKSYQPED